LIELILGGARSGKSRLAESRINSISQNNTQSKKSNIIYVATATAQDDEMSERILQHKKRRPQHWRLIEEPIQLANVLATYKQADNIVLIECLTLWLSNLLGSNDPDVFKLEKENFIQQIQESEADIILVSNETGLGVVPMGELSRRYVDEAGWLHQELAQISDRVTLVIAGLEQTLKTPLTTDGSKHE